MWLGNIKYIFFSSRRRHTIYWRDWSSDVCSSDLGGRWVQVSRLGNPLINELVIPYNLKDKFNRTQPKDDLKNFGKYALNPFPRSEERRVGEEWRSWWSPYPYKQMIYTQSHGSRYV